MTKTRQDKSAKPDAVELNDASLDRAAGAGSIGGIFVAGGDVNGDGRGGNTVYISGASGGVWKTTNF